MRVACLRIPDFPIAAHLRSEDAGQLPGLPMIVVRGEGKQAVVAAASKVARSGGIELGMRAADARAQHPGLQEWGWSPTLYDEVQTELAATLLAASPRVSQAGLGMFWLDAGGWDRMGGEEAFIEAARSAALAAGYPEACIGIADTAAAARAATRLRGSAVQQIKSGNDARFLATLPLRVLPISEELLELLAALGLETVGELAELEAGEVEARLGAEGVKAHRWARGLDDGKEGPFGDRPPSDWSAEVEFPGPIERLEPLLFLLKSCLDNLSDALAAQGLCLRGFELTIETEDGPAQQTIRPARPTRQVSLLLTLCRTALEDLQLSGRALGLRIEAEEAVPAVAEQADLFEPPRPDPDALANALTRLQGRWGPESVVRPTAADSHRPEKAGRWEPVDLMAELVRAHSPRGKVGLAGGRSLHVAPDKQRSLKGHRAPNVRSRPLTEPFLSRQNARASLTPCAPPEPVESEGNGDESTPVESPTLVLRLWSQPRPFDIRIEAGQPGAVNVDGDWRAVCSLQGPERLSGEWWEDHYRREYYRVSTAPGDLLWVFYDPRRRGWFWHGWWD
jgi:protein ImuB